MERLNPETFAVALEALVDKYGKGLNDNEVITALENQLARAWTDACEPQPAELFRAAPELLAALTSAEDLLAFHEGSARPEFEGAEPTVRVNGEDHAELLAKVRAALAKSSSRGVG